MAWMTVIADLHGRTPPVRQDSYLLLLAGDIAPDDGQYEWLDGPFRAWLRSLPCPCVAVPGNHDKLIFRGEHPHDLPFTLLTEAGVAEVGGLRVFGCPGVLDSDTFHASEDDFERRLAAMPERCDVLLTHNPPLGILDRPSAANHPGSLALRCSIWKKRPRLAVFGHIHEARGHGRFHDTYCVNATLGAGCARTGRPVPARYEPWGLSDNSWRRPGA